MDEKIFRKKIVDKIKSPDNLKDYIRVINPSVWIVFIAVFLLLAGAFVWGFAGKIEDKLTVTAVSQDGKVICSYDESVKEGMEVFLNGNQGFVSSVSSSGIIIKFEDSMPDGIYSGYIVRGEISPITFVIN